MFVHLPANSKVWIYQANRELNSSEMSFLLENLKLFIQDWAAHGSQLYGDVSIEDNRFVILVVDESKTGVSGCSIDTSVRKIKELGTEIGVDFFNRMNLYLKKENEFKQVHISEVKDFPDWNVYNPMVTNLQELRENWLIPVNQSPF